MLPDYRLLVRQQDDTYQARWIEADGQPGKEFPLRLPLDKDKLDRLRWYLEEYYLFPDHGERVKAEAVERELEQWGRDLFKALFDTPEGMQVYNNLLQHAEDGGCALTLGCEISEVLAQPWEMLRDERGPLALRGVAVRRQLEKTKRAIRYDFAPPLRILLIVARPRDTRLPTTSAYILVFKSLLYSQHPHCVLIELAHPRPNGFGAGLPVAFAT